MPAIPAYPSPPSHTVNLSHLLSPFLCFLLTCPPSLLQDVIERHYHTDPATLEESIAKFNQMRNVSRVLCLVIAVP